MESLIWALCKCSEGNVQRRSISWRSKELTIFRKGINIKKPDLCTFKAGYAQNRAIYAHFYVH